jgi:hypothetical protein
MDSSSSSTISANVNEDIFDWLMGDASWMLLLENGEGDMLENVEGVSVKAVFESTFSSILRRLVWSVECSSESGF